MKKYIGAAGFEFIFAIGLLLLITLPAMVYAQGPRRELVIIVQNGDTLVNGHKLSELNPDEKRNARLAFSNKRQDRPMIAQGGQRRLMFKRRGNDSLQYQFRPDSNNKAGRVYTENRRRFLEAPDHILGKRPDMDEYRMPYRDESEDAERFRDRAPEMRPRMPMRRGDRQDFSFRNVDKNGIGTLVNFHVSSVPNEIAKRVSGSEKNDLDIADLVLIPEISTGKTLLMFNLPTNTAAAVKLTDTDGKDIWGDKALGGKFSKGFQLPLNGVYFLVIKQGSKTAIKRIVKE